MTHSLLQTNLFSLSMTMMRLANTTDLSTAAVITVLVGRQRRRRRQEAAMIYWLSQMKNYFSYYTRVSKRTNARACSTNCTRDWNARVSIKVNLVCSARVSNRDGYYIQDLLINFLPARPRYTFWSHTNRKDRLYVYFGHVEGKLFEVFEIQ